MQSAKINNPNTGFVGRTFMGKGKQYRTYKVPDSIKPIEKAFPIAYDTVPNSAAAVFYEQQQIINRSFKNGMKKK